MGQADLRTSVHVNPFDVALSSVQTCIAYEKKKELFSLKAK